MNILRQSRLGKNGCFRRPQALSIAQQLASRHYARLLVTEYIPVEAQINPALGNRAVHTHGQLCAEKSGTRNKII